MNLDEYTWIYMHFSWHCGLLCCCLGIFAKSMHLLQTLVYWLCIYTYMYLTFVTLHFISSWFISSPIQWSGPSNEYIVCRYMFGISTRVVTHFPDLCYNPGEVCYVMISCNLCSWDFFSLMYIYIDLWFYALKSTQLLNGFCCQVLGYHAP